MIAFNAAVVQRGYRLRFWCEVLAVASLSMLILGLALPSQAESPKVPLESPQLRTEEAIVGTAQVSRSVPAASAFPGNQSDDPFKSAFPIPWALIQKAQAEVSQTGRAVEVRYRSPVLRAPDGQVQAYSDISLSIEPEATQSQISSQLVLTDGSGQVLQQIPASVHLGQGLTQETAAQHLKGVMAILIPATWSSDGQQLLARQFEAVFGSDVSSDYALVWSRDNQQAKTVMPLPLNYDSAILLGWSQAHPKQILFHTTLMGESDVAMVAVDSHGNTMTAQGDRPLQVEHNAPLATSPAQAKFSLLEQR